MKKLLIVLGITLLFTTLACETQSSESEPLVNTSTTTEEEEEVIEDVDKSEAQESVLTLEVTSDVLPEGEFIPKRYTCILGEDVSPPLKWNGAPNDTKSFAIVFDDPDNPFGPPFVHWVIYGIPSDVTELEEAVPRTEMLANGARQGINDFGNLGYGGPCPPGAGKIHAWVFKVYALDIEVDLAPGATKAELMNATSGHILAKGDLTRQYRVAVGNQ
jgi:Raf kinase inhibitor-like YbhB/YbcL family protein